MGKAGEIMKKKVLVRMLRHQALMTQKALEIIGMAYQFTAVEDKEKEQVQPETLADQLRGYH
jgi:hypothetical protein